MLEEFKKFVTRGNVVDLAVAFIMGLAFAAIVTTFVNVILSAYNSSPTSALVSIRPATGSDVPRGAVVQKHGARVSHRHTKEGRSLRWASS